MEIEATKMNWPEKGPCTTESAGRLGGSSELFFFVCLFGIPSSGLLVGDGARKKKSTRKAAFCAQTQENWMERPRVESSPHVA